MELVTLTTKEIRRLEVVQALAAGTLHQTDAAQILRLSTRQLRRLRRRYHEGGAAALASRRRGREPNNALEPALKQRALELYRTHYPDFGPTLAVEKLCERDGITISRETLRQWLIAADFWKPAKRRARARPPRARRSCFGELVQIDGSPHNWFERRSARCTLLLAVDDATSTVGAALFANAETTNNYFLLFEHYFKAFGLPEAFYSDRHSIFRINTRLTADRQTQVGRALEELDIELICANSPQAKGRIERANRTFQDRLVKELRLRNICDIDAANAYLPQFIAEHNAKFAKAPTHDFDAHRSIDGFNLDDILCQRTERTLTKDLTIQVGDRIYAVAPGNNRLRGGMRVQLHLQRDGRLTITHDRRELTHRLVQRLERNAPIVGAKELAERHAKRHAVPQRAHKPKADHPWKTARLPRAWRDSSALRSGDISALR